MLKDHRHKADAGSNGAPVSSSVCDNIDLVLSCKSYLIYGDNADALQKFGGQLRDKIKCIYIDPPYNNLETYSHYTDRDPFDEWLGKLKRHVAALRDFLTEDGSLWVSIDDRQMHYLKVALDEIFGRGNFVTTIVWEHRKSRENRKIFSNNHEYILLYAKDFKKFKKSRNRLPPNDELLSRYKNPDHDKRGPWQSVTISVQDGHAVANQFYQIKGPSGRVHEPPKGRCWVYPASRFEELRNDSRISFGRDGNGVPRLKKFLAEADLGLTPNTLWSADEVGTTETAKREVLDLFPEETVFDTPKPEALIARILEIGTDPDDYVLDSFLGSGTTAAVAIKMGRRFVGIEVGKHAECLCKQRIEIASKDHDHVYEIVKV